MERLIIITLKAVTLGIGLAQIEYPKVLLGRDVLNGWPSMRTRGWNLQCAPITRRLAISKGVPFKRIVTLMEADRAGRLVVLPRKDWLEVVFGDQVLFWGIDKDYVEQPIREISLDDADRIGWYDGYKTVFLKGTDENGEAWEFYPEEIGKTVFLTREEAEKALEAMKDD